MLHFKNKYCAYNQMQQISAYFYLWSMMLIHLMQLTQYDVSTTKIPQLCWNTINYSPRSSTNNDDIDIKANGEYKNFPHNREMQQRRYIFQSDDHLMNKEVKIIGVVVSPFHKGW